MGMIQRTRLLSIFCAAVIALAACSAPSATSYAPVATAQSDGERTTESVPVPLTVTQSVALLSAVRGTTVHFACAVSVVSFSAVYPYTITDWGTGTAVRGTGAFPIWNYPRASALSWSLAGGPVHTVANSGSPGETLLTGNASPLTQTHCVDLTLAVPVTQPAGTYSASIQYNVLERVGFIGLAISHQTATFTVVVRDH
jgi:hypothetical protein